MHNSVVLDDAHKGMTFEQIAYLQVFAEHGETFMSFQPLRINRLHAASDASLQSAVLEAVLYGIPAAESSLRRPCFNDSGDDPGSARQGADRDRGEGARPAGLSRRAMFVGTPVRRWCRWPPATPRGRAPGTGRPGRRLGNRLGVSLPEGGAHPSFSFFQVLDVDSWEFRTRKAPPNRVRISAPSRRPRGREG